MARACFKLLAACYSLHDVARAFNNMTDVCVGEGRACTRSKHRTCWKTDECSVDGPLRNATKGRRPYCVEPNLVGNPHIIPVLVRIKKCASQTVRSEVIHSYVRLSMRPKHFLFMSPRNVALFLAGNKCLRAILLTTPTCLA